MLSPRRTAAAAIVLVAFLGSRRPGEAGTECSRSDLVAASAQERVDPRALLEAACGPDCVVECRTGGEDQDKDHLFAHFEGSFRCPGKLESIVSLFPCDDAAGMHGVAGTIVYLRALKSKGKTSVWERAGEIEESVLGNGECKVVRVGPADVLACANGWGPYQGISGESLCVYAAKSEFASECPLRVEDSCESGQKGARAATIEGWTVGPASAGTVPLNVTIKRADCRGQGARTIEATVLVGASGARLSPETVALLKKWPVSAD